MGNCSGNVTSPADAFKMSIFNPIFNSPDWETFVGMCSIQEFPSGVSSTYVKILSTHCFHFVVEGEVTAYISNERGQQSQLATYTPGDLIYLAPGFKSSRGTLSCGGYKLFYQMQTLESPVRILSAERRRVDTFLNANPHCAQLAYLFSSSSPIIKDLSALSLFQSMTPEQVQLMLSVMKIARFEAEQVLCHDNNPSTSRSRTASLFPGKSVSILLKGEVELLSPILW